MSKDHGAIQDAGKPKRADKPSQASLLDAEARGGPNAIRGFDFQRRYALILLIESVTDPGWSAVLIEGAEDVQARFDRQGTVERHAIQLKDYRVTAAKAREIVTQFEKLDRDSPGTWAAFVIACTELDDRLKTVHNALAAYRPLHGDSFYAPEDAILANTRAEVQRQIGAANLPVEFVLERVRFEPGLQSYKDEAWVRARGLDLLHKAYPGINHAAAEAIYLRLKDLVVESTMVPISRQQAIAVIDALRSAAAGAVREIPLAPWPSPDELPDPGPLPPGSRFPFARNAVFTGRRADLLAIAHALGDRDGEVQQRTGLEGPGQTGPLVLAGMGGVGKTQLAVEFCYRYGRCFAAVHWLDARSDLAPEIAACGQALGIRPWPEGQPDQVAATLRTWAADPCRLVVLDNLEDRALLQDWLPRLGGVPALATSRLEEWPADLGVTVRPLDLLARAESLALLRALGPRLRGVPDAELDRVAERLGDLPLALDLAGRYLADVKTLAPADYLTELAGQNLLEHESLRDWSEHNPTRHATSLAETYLASWRRLASEPRRTGLAGWLFRACGYCAPNVPVPAAVLVGGAPGAPAEREVGRALRGLYRLGLLAETDAGPRAHPVLAEFARLQDGGAAESALPALATALGNAAGEANASGLPARAAPLRAHLATVAAAAERAGLAEAGLLWNELGFHLRVVAEFAGARGAFERALRIDEAAYGPDHPEVATVVNNLGGVLRALGDLAGARGAFERALRIDEAAYGPDHPNVAIRVNNLGGVLQDLGDLAGARGAFERALRIDEAAYGPDHPNVAIRVNNLGLVLRDLGDLAGARGACERALAIDEAAYGPDHPNVARDVNNLGGVLRALGDLAGARGAFERALRIDEAAYGPDHPNVAIRVNNLGGVLQDLGDLAVARGAFERALRIDEAAYGPDHPNVAIRVNNLGLVLRALGDLAGARGAFERALRIDEAAYGPDHPNVATVVNNLGLVLQDLGDLGGARGAFERALAIDEAAYGPDHPNVARDVNNLGGVLRALGDLAGARGAFERALRIDEAAYGPDHPNVAIRVNNLGGVLQDLGDLAGARGACERALVIFERVLPADHPTIARVRRNLESLG